jgi:hypothetical protein
MLNGANLCPWKSYNLDIHEALLRPCGVLKPHLSTTGHTRMTWDMLTFDLPVQIAKN